MKTDLSRILAISGQSGLYLYISQARNGAVVEALSDKKRSSVGMTSKITSLADISIYTDDEEVKLQQVFLNMKDVLANKLFLGNLDNRVAAIFIEDNDVVDIGAVAHKLGVGVALQPCAHKSIFFVDV